MTDINWNTCAFADEGCTCGRPSLAMVEKTELEKLRAELAKVREQLTAANRRTDDTEVIERVEQRANAHAVVVEAAKVWRFSGSTAGDHREAIAALNAAVDALPKAEAAAEHRCPNCAPGYDCERGIYTPAVAS
ncbi:hypothetical protein ACIBEF_00665 [Micromonospora sp. NPDC050795]|uniref:hypothetical protein n=1 Tax=Micromonospora sp. NPDC050795 TaxID=3364282 RepID=UPI0037AE1D6B